MIARSIGVSSLKSLISQTCTPLFSKSLTRSSWSWTPSGSAGRRRTVRCRSAAVVPYRRASRSRRSMLGSAKLKPRKSIVRVRYDARNRAHIRGCVSSYCSKSLRVITGGAIQVGGSSRLRPPCILMIVRRPVPMFQSIVVLRGDAGVGSCRFQQRIEVGRPDLVDRELRDEVMTQRRCPVRGQLLAQVILQRRAPAGTVLLVVLGEQWQIRERARDADLGGERAQEVAPGRQSGRRGQAGAHEQRGDSGIDGAAEDPHELVPVDGHPDSVPRPARARSEAAWLSRLYSSQRQAADHQHLSVR